MLPFCEKNGLPFLPYSPIMQGLLTDHFDPREWSDDDVRQPNPKFHGDLWLVYKQLADKVKVASLPGGGFRGDWYIGVSRGSVSNELGKQLVHMLCSEREQYKRFALGVGLPTLQSFRKPDNNYFAWLYGENVPVKLLYDIHSHDQTNTRREIPDYNNFRSTLTTICQQLIRPDYDKLTTKPGDLEKKVKLNVGRLFRQIAMLSDKYGSHNTVKVP